MNFNSNSRHSFRKKRINWVNPKTLGLVLLIVSLSILLFYPAGEDEIQNSSFLSRSVLSVTSIVYSGKNWISEGFSGFLDNFRAKTELEKAHKLISELQEENTELRYRLRRYENYRAAENLPETVDYLTLKSIVLKRDDRLATSLIIDRGTSDNVKPNLPVWTAEGLVGRTYKVMKHASRVQPITDPGSAVGVKVQGTSYEAILRGTEDGRKLVLTDQHYVGFGSDELLKPMPGQKVVTSNRGLVFPEDIVAGVITEATTEEGLIVEPAVDMRTVQAVYVLLNSPLKEEILSLMTEE